MESRLALPFRVSWPRISQRGLRWFEILYLLGRKPVQLNQGESRYKSNQKSSPQVSRTLLRILAVLNRAVVWTVSTCPLTSKSSSPFNNPLVTVPNAPITIGIIVTFMFHNLFNSLAKSRYLSFFKNSFSFILWSAGTAKSTILQVLFFLLIIIRSGILNFVFHFHWFDAQIFVIIIYSFSVFLISVSWWFFIGVWVTASLLKSPGLVSGFWPFSAMLSFG